MKHGNVYYMHDSTESTEDNFTLSVSAYEIGRRSLPLTIWVTVIPVNDEPPKLTRNTGTEVILCSYERVIDDQFSHMLIKPEKLTYWNPLYAYKVSYILPDDNSSWPPAFIPCEREKSTCLLQCLMKVYIFGLSAAVCRKRDLVWLVHAWLTGYRHYHLLQTLVWCSSRANMKEWQINGFITVDEILACWKAVNLAELPHSALCFSLHLVWFSNKITDRSIYL